jgi:hypothetical protein
MVKMKWNLRRPGFVLAAVLAAGSLLLPLKAWAGTAQIVEVEQGATPFIAYAGAFYNGSNIASVGYSIVPKSGSLTRALGATYSASYLTSHNYFIPGANAVVIPIFGLYAGTNNTIDITYTFTDKTVSTQTATITTPSYTDPCAPVTQRTFLGIRPTTGSLTFDYFLLKDYCSANSPAIFDTEGNIRWVGDAGGGSSATAFFNNAFYFSDGKTGIKRIDITNGQVTKIGDYASIGVTNTGHHNADPGRNGLIFDVNTTTQTEAADIEINPATGAVLNTWDLGAIVSAAMTAGGDNPAGFVLGTAADWFHNNAVAYNPADNTLIVSSRENFVIAVDYDAPATGQRKIHWILGDTTKAWHSYQSLAKYTLTLGAGTVPPAGQHAVSVDHQGNVLLFDNGLGSLTLTPAGVTRNYSAARAYHIDTTTMTATETFTYTAANAGQNLFSPICGSVYDVAGNYLVDFSTANAAAAAAAQANQSPGAIVNTLLTGSGTSGIYVGVGNSNLIEFVMQIPMPTPCASGWNAVPFAGPVFTF